MTSFRRSTFIQAINLPNKRSWSPNVTLNVVFWPMDKSFKSSLNKSLNSTPKALGVAMSKPNWDHGPTSSPAVRGFFDLDALPLDDHTIRTGFAKWSLEIHKKDRRILSDFDFSKAKFMWPSCTFPKRKVVFDTKLTMLYLSSWESNFKDQGYEPNDIGTMKPHGFCQRLNAKLKDLALSIWKKV